MSNLTPHLVQLAVTLPRPMKICCHHIRAFLVRVNEAVSELLEGHHQIVVVDDSDTKCNSHLAKFDVSGLTTGDDQPGCSIGTKGGCHAGIYAADEVHRLLDMPVLMHVEPYRSGHIARATSGFFGLMSPLQLLGAQATMDLLCCALGERKILPFIES